MFRYARNLGLWICFGCAALLTACGGGGGGGESPITPGDDTPPPAPDVRSLAGHAVKGIIQGGLVVVEEIDSSGTAIRELAQLTTGDDGEYFMTVPDSYAGGPVRLTLFGVSGQTNMVCDVMPSCADVPFGQPVPVDQSFSLTTLLPRLGAQDTYTQINPFTDLAASRASELGGYTPENIASAQSEVNNLFSGMSFDRARGVNIADYYLRALAGGMDTTVGLLNSSIAKLAFDQGKTIPQVQAELRTAFTGGTIAAAGDGLTLESLANALQAQFAALRLDDDLGLIADLRNDIAVAKAANALIDPIPSALLNASKLEQGRALVSDARAIGYGLIEDYGTTSFFVHLIDYAKSPAMKYLTYGARRPLEDALAVLVEAYGINTGADGVYTDSDLSTLGSGTIELITLGDGKKQAVVNWSSTRVYSTMTLTFADPGTTLPEHLEIDLSGSAVSFQYVYNGGSLTTQEPFEIRYDDVNVSVSYQLSADPAPGGGPDLDVLAAQFSGPIVAILDSPPNRRLESDRDIVLSGDLDFSYTADEILPEGRAVYSGTLDFAGTARLTNLQGFVAQFNLTAVAERLDESDHSNDVGTVSASYSAVDAGGDTSQLTVAMNLDGRAQDGDYLGDGNITLTHNGKTVRIFVATSEVGSKSYDLAVENDVGVMLRIADAKGDGQGTLTVQGETVAVITRINALYKVSYIDGTFETLN